TSTTESAGSAAAHNDESFAGCTGTSQRGWQERSFHDGPVPVGHRPSRRGQSSDAATIPCYHRRRSCCRNPCASLFVRGRDGGSAGGNDGPRSQEQTSSRSQG